MGSLLLGLFYLGEVAFVGKVEVPFEHRHELHVRLAEQAAADPPFVTLPRQLRGAHWVKPGLACAVDCSGLTGGPDLRAPAYIGLLPEVDAAHCALAQLDEAFGQRRAG
jgi:bifunctional non-homologous end joining protein LigD